MALGYLVIAIAVHFWIPLGVLFCYSSPVVGTIVLCLGFAVMTWGWALFRTRKATICPTEPTTVLVFDGPYRFSRNPMYLGISLILLGIAFCVGPAPFYLVPLAFFITINATFVPYEEKKLESAFGQEYLDYKKRVRRWL